MNLTIFPLRSIKNRVTLFTLAIFLVSILVLALYGRGILRQTVRQLLGEQQLSTASIIAAGVNQELADRLGEIEAVAGRITPAMLGNAPALQALLDQGQNLPLLFNKGAFVVTPEGQTIASMPRSAERIGAGFKGWDFIAAALELGKATIGQPPMDSKTQAPIAGIAAPIRDHQGRVIGVLLGLTDLSQSNFLEKFAKSSYGKTGGYLLVSAQHRLVVTGSDRSGLVDALPSSAIDPLIERFIQGYEGSGIVVNAAGEEVLASGKGVPLAGWSVLVTLPTEEAFAPFRAARKHMLLATIVLGLLASAAIWLILRRELTPMLTTVKTLAALSETELPPQPLEVPSQGEIAELIGAFNHLLATLGQREEALKLAEAELRIAATAFESHEGMMVTDADSVILRINKAFSEITGYRADEVVGQTPRLFKSGRHDASFYREMWDTINATGGWQGEIWDRRKNGEIYPKWLTISAVKSRSGVVTHYVGVHFDITERKRSENQVHQLAFYDPLTKLPNRRLFNDRLGQAMAASKRNACFGALMFLDLDNFKSLNDTGGHLAGDLLLVAAANRLRYCVREMDTVARFGGDEFLVLLGDLTVDRAESVARTKNIAEKIRLALSEPYLLTVRHDGQADVTFEHHCTASIGVAMLSDDGTSPEDVLKWADAAMYRAKAAGRNSIKFYHSEL